MLEDTGQSAGTTTEATGTPEGGATDSGAATTQTPSPANPEFISSLGETLRSNESLFNFENVDGLASAFIEGSDKVKTLEQQLQEAQAQIPKLPASSADYEVNLPEGYSADDRVFAEFKDMAHKANLTGEQIEAVLQFDFNRTNKAVAMANNEAKKVIEDFQTEWGADYKKNKAMVDRAIVAIGGDDFAKAITDSGLAYNKNLVNGFLNIAKKMGEHIFADGNQNTGSSDRPVGIDGKPLLKFDM